MQAGSAVRRHRCCEERNDYWKMNKQGGRRHKRKHCTVAWTAGRVRDVQSGATRLPHMRAQPACAHAAVGLMSHNGLRAKPGSVHDAC